jgi:uncharacterized protein
MIPLIAEKRAELEALCARYRVRRLELFGSATGDRFDPESSDLDFLVVFNDLEPGEHFSFYFGLEEALRMLFGRPVDLVMLKAVKNPYFLAEIEPSRMLLYAA